MEKKLEIKLKRAINFHNHLQLCRLCLSKFNANERKINITRGVQNYFRFLTQLNLNPSPLYSKTICTKCNHFLNEFVILKNDWIFKQTQLQRLVESPVVGLSEEENIKSEGKRIEPEIDTDTIDNADFQSLDSDDEIETKKDVKLDRKRRSSSPEFEIIKKQKVERNFKCKHCSSAFQREQTLQNHQVSNHPETLSMEEIKDIKKRDKARRIKICAECGIATDNLKRHIRYLHQGVKQFICDYCDYATYHKGNMRHHVLKHIKLEKIFPCHICCKKFARQSLLNNHIRNCHNNKDQIFKCHCGKEYNTRGKLYKHNKMKHMEEANVSCPHCNKDMMKSYLAEHMRVDLEDKCNTYVCNECGKVFPNKRCLNHHRTLHQERNFVCDFQNCNRTYLSLAHLQSHQKLHLNPQSKNHKCPYEHCPNSYAKHRALRIHMAIKHENYRKKCPVDDCTYETGIFQSMRCHIRTHKNLKPEVIDEYIISLRKLNLL